MDDTNSQLKQSSVFQGYCKTVAQAVGHKNDSSSFSSGLTSVSVTRERVLCANFSRFGAVSLYSILRLPFLKGFSDGVFLAGFQRFLLLKEDVLSLFLFVAGTFLPAFCYTVRGCFARSI